MTRAEQVLRCAALALILVGAVGAPALADRPPGTIFWPARIDYPLPAPWGVTIDVSGDGIPDYVHPNLMDETTGVLRGTAPGRFESEPYRTYPSSASEISVIDMDGDGRDDLVFLGRRSPVCVVVAGADGSFPEMTTTEMISDEMPVIGHMNDDPYLDILIVGYGDYFVYYGNGDGTFGPPTGVYGDDARPRELSINPPPRVANLDGNAYDDIVHEGFVVLRSAEGITETTLDVPVPLEPYEDIAFADFDEDGIADIVIGDRVDVIYARGIGTGQFEAPIAVHPYSNSGVIDVRDVNGDGHLDVVAWETACLTCPMSVTMGRGDGTFDAPHRYAVNELALNWRQLADTDLDGHEDVVTGYDVLSVFYGLEDGSIGDAPFLTLAPDYASSHQPADMDGDGVMDIVVRSGYRSPTESRASIVVLRGLGDGAFSEVHRRGIPTDMRLPPLTGDVDGDGVMDVVCGGSDLSASRVLVLRGLGGGALKPLDLQTVPFGALDERRLADVGGDGALDLVGAVGHGRAILVLPGLGDGTFGTAVIYDGQPHPWHIAVGDVDRDGRDDVVFSDGNALAMRLGRSDGSLSDIRSLQAYARTDALTLGDVDGDGWLDVVHVGQNILTVLPSKGGGLFASAITQSDDVLWSTSYLEIGDLSGDGVPDIWAAEATGTGRVLKGVGNGTFTLIPTAMGPRCSVSRIYPTSTATAISTCPSPSRHSVASSS